MKTAEEWDRIVTNKLQDCVENTEYDAREEFISVIKAIQLDAWKQGMTDAANEVDNERTLVLSDHALLNAVKDSIQLARDNRIEI